MEYLLDTRELTSLEVLTCLYSENKWWTISAISEEIYRSPDQIKGAISLLKLAHTLDPYFEILSKRGHGIKLIQKQTVAFKKIKALFTMESVTFKILDTLFNDSGGSIESLADKLYISRSSLYRYLTKLTNYLGNNLTIDKKNLKICGDELIIRELYYLFMLSTINAGIWPFPQVNEQYLRLLIDTNISNYGIVVTPSDYLQILYRLGVVQTRINRKNFFEQALTFNILDSDSYFEKFVTIDYNLPAKNKQAENSYLRLIESTFPSIQTNPNTIKQIVEHHRLTNSLQYQCYLLFIQNISLNVMLSDTVIYEIICHLNYALIFPKLEFLNDSELTLRLIIEEAVQDFPELYASIQYSVQQLNSLSKDIDTTYLSYRLFSVILDKTDVTTNSQEIHIKLISFKNSMYEKIMENKLRHYLKEPAIISTSKIRNDTHFPYNLIISDLEISTTQYPKSKKIYFYDSFLTLRDWENIVKIIENP